MIRVKQKIRALVALWNCQNCSIWWGSQPAEEPATWRLFRLEERQTNPLLWKSNYPTWKVAGPDSSICPECGQQMIEHEVSAQEISAHYLN